MHVRHSLELPTFHYASAFNESGYLNRVLCDARLRPGCVLDLLHMCASRKEV
jgi:hypothetical protein